MASAKRRRTDKNLQPWTEYGECWDKKALQVQQCKFTDIYGLLSTTLSFHVCHPCSQAEQ